MSQSSSSSPPPTSSPPSTPNFSRPLPPRSPFNNMGIPSRQPRATSRDRVPSISSRPGVPPRISSMSYTQVHGQSQGQQSLPETASEKTENQPPVTFSAALPQSTVIGVDPDNNNNMQPSTPTQRLRPRRMRSIQDLTTRSQVPPGPKSADCRIAINAIDPDHQLEREVSLSDFLKEGWRELPITSQGPLSSPSPYTMQTPEHPPVSPQTSVGNKDRLNVSSDIEVSGAHENSPQGHSHGQKVTKDNGDRHKVDIQTHELSKESSTATHSPLPPVPRSSSIGKDKHQEKSSDVPTDSAASINKDTTVHTRSPSQQPNNGRPIFNFKPSLWKHLDVTRDKLNINLFWPKKIEDLEDDEYDSEDEENTFPFDAMKPLLQFRNLKKLTLGGMERSYQRIIWHAVLLNPQLTTLTLEMALEPVIIPDALPKFMPVTKDYVFPVPIPGWGSTTYLGSHGSGMLHPEFGTGEFLDIQAIAAAFEDAAHSNLTTTATSDSMSAAPTIPGPQVIKLQTLILRGFVINATPFFRYFSAEHLRTIVLKDGCIDAGFMLPPGMRKTTQVLLGGSLAIDGEVHRGRGTTARMYHAGDPNGPKIVTLKKGKVVDEEAVEVVKKPGEGVQLRRKFSGLLKGLKGKE